MRYLDRAVSGGICTPLPVLVIIISVTPLCTGPGPGDYNITPLCTGPGPGDYNITPLCTGPGDYNITPLYTGPGDYKITPLCTGPGDYNITPLYTGPGLVIIISHLHAVRISMHYLCGFIQY